MEKFTAFDSKLSVIGGRLDTVEKTLYDHTNSITQIDGVLASDSIRIKALEDNSAEQLQVVNELKTSTEFISSNYDALKLKVAEIDAIKAENVLLKKRADDLCNDVEQEKISRNIGEQYLRTSLNIKLCGVPAQPGEEIQTKNASNPVTVEVVKQVCQQLDVLLPPPAIDVCHRLSDDPLAPIIIRFMSKNTRFNFVAQKGKFDKVTSADVDLSSIQIPPQMLAESAKRATQGRGGSNGARSRRPNRTDLGASASSSTFEGGFDEPTPIYLQEHLTKRNKDLLKDAKSKLRGTFQFPGYVYHGEIRAKWDPESRHHVIKSFHDITKLLHQAAPR